MSFIGNFLNGLKKQPFLWGIYVFYSSYFGIKRNKLGFCAKDAIIIPPVFIDNPSNVYLYENTNIYSNSMISATHAKFIMKKNSGAADGLMVRTGNHMYIAGRWFKDITKNDKTKEYDKDVIVEEDVWIAANVTLLSGVKVGRGSAIGAGSVVRHSTPPYSIVAGNPAKVIGFVFSPEEIIEHEKALYPESERLPMEILEKNYKKYYIDRIQEIKNFIKQ